MDFTVEKLAWNLYDYSVFEYIPVRFSYPEPKRIICPIRPVRLMWDHLGFKIPR